MVEPGAFHYKPQGKLNDFPPEETEKEEARVDEIFVREYRLLKQIFNLKHPTILYPACGFDISLSEVFPDSHTYYVDTDPNAIAALRRAGLPENTTHIILQSAYDFKPPMPIDLVVLRNPTTDKYDIVGLVRGLKAGGYVVESHWGCSGGSRDLLKNLNFNLIGHFIHDKKLGTAFYTNAERISRILSRDKGVISKHAGSGYVFQKK